MHAPSYALPRLLRASAVRRFSHHARFEMAIKLLHPMPGESILDYGTGDGKLLKLLQPYGCALTGYEPDSRNLPFLARELEGIASATDEMGRLPRQFDKITCLEVLEHVSETEALNILGNCARLITPNGRLVVSVPLEIGPSSIFKNIFRILKKDGREANATLANILRAGMFMHVHRLDFGGGYFGHMGFDYRTLENKFLTAGWNVLRRTYSPFPPLRNLINSQVFYVLAPTTDDEYRAVPPPKSS